MGVESIKYGDICDKCAHVEYCDMATFGGHNPRITACSHFSQSKQTNADRIRAMSDEELAEFITPVKCVDCRLLDCGVEEEMFYGKRRTCQERVLDWLKEEAEDERTD